MIKNDDNLRSILLKKETPKLNFDFEEQLMSQIHQQVSAKATNKKTILKIYIFFALGLVLGFFASLSFGDSIFSFEGTTDDFNEIFFVAPLIFGLLFIFEKVYNTILFQKGKEKIFEM